MPFMVAGTPLLSWGSVRCVPRVLGVSPEGGRLSECEPWILPPLAGLSKECGRWSQG
jgi:hypothetical protein